MNLRFAANMARRELRASRRRLLLYASCMALGIAALVGLHGVRATVYAGGSIDLVRLAREHNNGNVLSLGARFIALAEAKEAIDLWLVTPFSGIDRHIRRNVKLDNNAIDIDRAV